MAKFKIIAIAHLLKNNEMAKSGEIVDESKFINLQDSLKRKICEEVKEDEGDDDKDTRTPEEIKAAENLKVVKKYNKEKLIEFAVENKIEFNLEDNKKEIAKAVLPKVDENSVLLKEEGK